MICSLFISDNGGDFFMKLNLFKKQKAFITYALFFLACSCSLNNQPNGSSFDPKIPGGVGGPGSILSVTSPVASIVNNQVLLTWSPPVVYLGLDSFKVHIFRRNCDVNDDACIIDYPELASISSFQVTESQGMSFVDSGATLGQNYTYWFYVEYNGSYDKGKKVGIKVPDAIPSITPIYDYSKFWQTTGFGIGSFTGAGTPISANTLNFGPTTPLSPIMVTGKFAFGKGGSLLYISDSANNRVLVYGRQGALGCDSVKDKTSDTYKACLASAAQEPYVPLNIIGQPDQSSNKSCQEHLRDKTPYGSSLFVSDDNGNPFFDKCLTSPTGIFVEGDNLIISDTGNDRVVVHKILPNNIACDKHFSSSQSTTERCAADAVIGKKGFQDVTYTNDSGVVINPSYSVATDGESALYKPGDVVAKDGNLFILDSGNNRIVRVKQYASQSYWVCTPSTWREPVCSFSAILGQKNYRETKTLSSELANGNLLLNPQTSTLISSSEAIKNSPQIGDYSNFLSKHFENPTTIRLDSSGHLFVGSFENYHGVYGSGLPVELKARILVFNISSLEGDDTSCNIASFSADGCSAIKIIGQDDVNRIPMWSNGFGSYETAVSYGLEYVSSIEVSGDALFAVQPKLNTIKVWTKWSSIQIPGTPRDQEVLNPGGVTNPSNQNLSLPDLKAISFLSYESISKKFFVSDSSANKIYEVILSE